MAENNVKRKAAKVLAHMAVWNAATSFVMRIYISTMDCTIVRAAYLSIAKTNNENQAFQTG